ncbi:hypothetical protein [Methyloradius palustris]|uniref:Uncharacterized protein n=1 Tax=Methyloradius palustris TaxID=2778876 RepID=A0A8D5JQV5_9PROT|nr:hypothetical protein [Methyloradius palustris]BCM24851.1 hypothetical protein ZMTM_11100 [Methyloradius palustris]
MQSDRNNSALGLPDYITNRKPLAIFEKTPAGLAEINAENRALNVRQRQILILIDGKRNSDDLQAGLKNTNVLEILLELETLGFVIDTAKKPVIVETADIPAISEVITTPTAYTLDTEIQMNEDQVNTVKQILLSSTDEYLGIMGRGMKSTIITATGYLQIKACVSQWHMAMRESKLGRVVAGTLMEQVQASMKTQS